MITSGEAANKFHGSSNTGCIAASVPLRSRTVKKLKTRLSVRKRLQKKREARALRSKAKQAHRRGTGYKDLEDAE